jgi:hypothetical protein
VEPRCSSASSAATERILEKLEFTQSISRCRIPGGPAIRSTIDETCYKTVTLSWKRNTIAHGDFFKNDGGTIIYGAVGGSRGGGNVSIDELFHLAMLM